MTALLSIDAVSKRFRGLLAVDNVSLRVAQGSIFAVIGPNGAGKTTLFNIIAGMSAPDSGSIAFAGERIDGLTPDEICRRGIGRTFQLVRPFPTLSVEDNVVIGAMLHRHDPAVARRRARRQRRRDHSTDGASTVRACPLVRREPSAARAPRHGPPGSSGRLSGGGAAGGRPPPAVCPSPSPCPTAT